MRKAERMKPFLADDEWKTDEGLVYVDTLMSARRSGFEKAVTELKKLPDDSTPQQVVEAVRPQFQGFLDFCQKNASRLFAMHTVVFFSRTRTRQSGLR